MLEELADAYGTQWTTTMMFVAHSTLLILRTKSRSDISTNEQKKEWFLRLNPNGTFVLLLEAPVTTTKYELGRIPVIVDNQRATPFPVMETSAELLYLLNYADKDYRFGFADELEKSECIQWLFFWHGSGAPYQGNLGFFNRAAEKIPCMILLLSPRIKADELITSSCH